MFLGLNKEQWKSALRTLVTVSLTWLLAKGYLTQDETDQYVKLVTDLAPVLAILGTILWGIVTRSDKNLTTAAGALPGVEVKVDTSVAPAGAVAAAMDNRNNNVTVRSEAPHA
jgi:hypothetical protein